MLRRNSYPLPILQRVKERPFAAAFRYARTTLVRGPHHEELIRHRSNTSALQNPTRIGAELPIDGARGGGRFSRIGHPAAHSM